MSELTLLGSVDVGITRFEPGRALYGATECRITIESLRGIAAASTATALLGQFELAEGSDEPSDGHLH